MFSMKGGVAAEEDVEYDSDGPHVGAFVVRDAVQNFWGDVALMIVGMHDIRQFYQSHVIMGETKEKTVSLWLYFDAKQSNKETLTHRSAPLRHEGTRSLHYLGKSKVRNLDTRIVRLAPQQQILRLEIPMRHPPIVTVRQRLQQDAAHVPGLLLVIKALLHNSVKQLSAVHGLHDKVKHVGLFEKVVEADNVGAF